MNCSGELKDFKPTVICYGIIFTLSIHYFINSLFNIMKRINRITSLLVLLFVIVLVCFRFIAISVKHYFYPSPST